MAFSSTEFLVLVSLQDGPLHGYSILKSGERLGLPSPPVATLYATIERLERTKWIIMDREEIADGRVRRFFALTAAGRNALLREGERMQASVELIRPTRVKTAGKGRAAIRGPKAATP